MARFIYPAGGGGSASADIADFIFINEDEDVSKMTLPINKEMTIETTRDDGEDADINIRAADDVWITAYGDDVNINAFDEARIYSNNSQYEWRFNRNGCLELPGNGEICNPINSSGDGLGLPTISINPDTSTEDNRYIIIDPTAPNHIHIRAGGTIDESSANLFLGGEKNNVVVSDSSRDVFINTRPDMIINSYTNLNEVNNINFIVSNTADINVGYTVNVDGTEYLVDSVTPDGGLIVVTATGAVFTAGESYTFFYNPPYTNSWEFGSNGYLFGPAMGGLLVSGLFNGESNLWLGSNDSIVLNGGESGGEFLNDSSVPSNQIATIGDIAAVTARIYHGSFYSTQTQSASADNVANPMTLNNTDFNDGVSIVDNSKVTIANAGKYNIAFSAQIHRGAGGGTGKEVNIWLAKNGNPVSNSNTRVQVQPDYPWVVAAWNFFVDAAANDYYEIMWAPSNSHISLYTEVAGVHPAIPSVILTVNQVA